ncbi:EscN/YscN/HrcN family type III secretion system ATPase, partial [Salmonella enterica subsp. enterica serovar Poona]
RRPARGPSPAIDVLPTLSGVFPDVTRHAQRQLEAILRRGLALYQEVELLIRIGEYQRGVDTDTDKAIDTYPDICTFLRQSKDEVCGPELLIEKLHQILTE